MNASKTAKREPAPKKPVVHTLAESQARLRESGLKSTASRLAVLRHMETVDAPSSHAEVAVALLSKGFDRATLYRNLIDLTHVGILSKSDFGDHVFRFELRGAHAGHGAEHPHFVCTDCGTVSCLPEVRVKITAPPNTPNVAGNDVAVQLKGRCEQCT